MCGDLAFPNVTDEQRDTILSPVADAPTARERLAPLTEDPQCASCHNEINAIGLALENFDALGQWRDIENGATIDASGAIDQSDDADGTFQNAEEFVGLIANSSRLQYCYSEKLFRYAMGRLDTEQDACALSELRAVADDSDGDIREFLVGMTQTDSFFYRRGQ